MCSSGQHWQAKRKMLTPAFHFDILREYTAIFPKHAATLCNKLRSAAESGEHVELLRYTSLAALDVIGECTMGVQFHAQEQPESEYINAVSEASHLIFQRSMNPLTYLGTFCS